MSAVVQPRQTPSEQLTLVAHRASALLLRSASPSSVSLHDVERGLTWAETYTSRIEQLAKTGRAMSKPALEATELLAQSLASLQPLLTLAEVDFVSGSGAMAGDVDGAEDWLPRVHALRERCDEALTGLQYALRDAYALFISHRGAA